MANGCGFAVGAAADNAFVVVDITVGTSNTEAQLVGADYRARQAVGTWTRLRRSVWVDGRNSAVIVDGSVEVTVFLTTDSPVFPKDTLRRAALAYAQALATRQ